MKSSLKRKLAKTVLYTALAYTGYVATGNIYALYRSASYQSEKRHGFFNRKRDKVFYDEMKKEAFVLEDKVNRGLNTSKHNYSLEIIVSDDIKSFFDDDGNLADNDAWTDYVLDSVLVLNEYNKASVGFKLSRVGIVSDLQAYDEIMNFSQLMTFRRTKTFKVYLLPYEKSMVFSSPLFFSTAAFTYSNTGLIVLGISANEHRNKILMLHEVGHVLGLKHTKFLSTTKRMLLDPYCVFYKESIMVPNVDVCTGLELKPDEIKQLLSRDED